MNRGLRKMLALMEVILVFLGLVNENIDAAMFIKRVFSKKI